MRFADPLACPDCRGAIAGTAACPHCGLDLTSSEVRQLWQTLLQADVLLTKAQQLPRVDAGTAAAAAAAAPPVPPVPVPPVQSPSEPFVATPPDWRPYPVPGAAGRQSDPSLSATSPAKERSWSVGTILLVLGAFGLVVAGLIFVTRSWDEIGLTGKTLILLGVTAAIGALGVWVTRRPLRASAEAVWSVFLALLTLDVFAARYEDLLGLGVLDLAAGWLAWGVIALGLSLAVAVWARPFVGTALVAPAVAGGLAIVMGGIGASAIGDDWDIAWRALIALVVAGLMALATRPAALAPMTLVARIVVAGFYVVAYAAAIYEIVDHPELDGLFGHGAPLLLMAVASVVVARLVPVVRIPAAALAVLGVSILALVPVAEVGDEAGTWVVTAAIAVVLAAAGTRGGDDAWIRGVRLGAVPAITGAVVIQAVLVADVLETMGRIIDDPWQLAWDVRLDLSDVPNHAGWVVPIVLAALLATTWCVSRWPELAPHSRPAAPAVGSALAIGAVTSVVALRWPVWLVALTLVAVAAVLVGLRLRRIARTPTPVAAFLVVAASVLAPASQGVSVTTWLLGGLLLGVLALTGGATELRRAYGVAAVALVLAGVAALTDLVGADAAVLSVVVVAVSLLLMGGAQAVLRDQPAGAAIEVASAVGMFVALVNPGSSSDIAVRWTIAGVGLITLGFVSAGRRWLLWPGIASLVVAYVALIVDSGFSFVEAYTLPLGAAGLAVGLVLAGRKPDTSTWTLLGPGLALTLLPSVPQSLAEPTELRALLLGVGALVVLTVGIRLGWQAPFVAGALILALLVLFNIGPYANAAPRVVLIAAVSAVLLGVGITWEDRVRDGRKLAGYVRSMR